MKARSEIDPAAVLRAMRGPMTQAEMAAICGIKQPTLSEIESGARSRSAARMEGIVFDYAAVLLRRLTSAGDDWWFDAVQVLGVARIDPAGVRRDRFAVVAAIVERFDGGVE